MSGKTPCHHAAFTGNELFIVYATAFGADMNARDNEEKTPLILCCKSYDDHRSIDCLKKLLLGGSDKELRDAANYRAIDYLEEFDMGQTDVTLRDSIKILKEK